MDLNDLLENLNTSVSSSYDRNMEKMLDQLGLEQKRATQDVVLPALGVFGAGIAVGASLGLLFAPKRGQELRSDIQDSLEDLREKSAEEYEELREKSEKALEAAREKVGDEDTKGNSPTKSKKSDGDARAST
jgi:gas vesicle protein